MDLNNFLAEKNKILQNQLDLANGMVRELQAENDLLKNEVSFLNSVILEFEKIENLNAEKIQASIEKIDLACNLE